MKFVDYKCNDCGVISECYVKSDDSDEIKCEACGSRNMIRIFAPINSKKSSSNGDFSSSGSSSGKSCSGSCGSCGGCSSH